MQSPKMTVISACLAGVRCRYDGDSKPDPRIVQLVQEGRALPVCPEQLGGLPTPRVRHERQGDRVISEYGQDATESFTRGAEEALRLAQLAGCTSAIVKARSPSCGCGIIYDGTFKGGLVQGDGVFAALLKRHGLRVLTEDELP